MRYLTKKDIIAINAMVQHANGTQPQIRDAAALDSIIQGAQQEVFGTRLYDTPVKLATFYLVKLDKRHVFNDANKRTAVVAMWLTLRLNGVAAVISDAMDRVAGDLAIKIARVNGEPDTLLDEAYHTVSTALIVKGH